MATTLSILISDTSGCLICQRLALAVVSGQLLQKPRMKSSGGCVVSCTAFRGSDRFTAIVLIRQRPEKEELVMATHNLSSCSEYLGKAVRHLAVNSGTPQDKLRSMVENTSLGSIHENDFPTGPLKNDFQAIMEKLSTASPPQMLVNIAAMSNEEARSLIEQICRLSDGVWSGLGKT